jgi:hypothetical protein
MTDIVHSSDIQSNRILEDQAMMLEAMKCLVGRDGASYISGPITTGRTFLAWCNRGNLRVDAADKNSLEFRTYVIQANEKAILRVAEDVRKRQSRPVIEPASLAIPHWSQSHYIRFWIDALDRFVSDVVMVDGWQFSAGCAAEFAFSTRKGYRIYSESGRSLSKSDGNDLILKAICEIENYPDISGQLSRLKNSLQSAIM